MTLLFDKPTPLPEAIRKLGSRHPVVAEISSTDWAKVPLQLREQAQFSAGVERIRVMDMVDKKLAKAIAMIREQTATGKEALVDRSSFIGDLRKLVLEEGLGSGDGTLTDLSSRARLGLIFDMQTEQANQFARWKVGQDRDVLDAAPAQELIRIDNFDAVARGTARDWPQIWLDAGGRFFGNGRMIALKTDPIWMAISRFGTPWPPFDYNSGMGVEDVLREEAEALGLLARDQAIEPTAEADFAAEMQASVTDVSPDLAAQLQAWFGDQVEIVDGTVRWRAAA
jgi:hypothetical protein